MPAQAYHLPNFLVHLPSKPGGKISPYFGEADDGYNTWVRKNVGWSFAAETYNAEIPLLAALAWPRASYQELRAALDYMTSSLMLEVWTDRRSSAEAKTRSQLWINALSQREKGETCEHPFIKTMRRELVPNMKAAVDPFHWPQLIGSSVDYANSTIQEALDRESYTDKNIVCDIQKYIVMRREAIGMRPCLVLMRSMRRLYIPDDIMAHPIVKEMEDVAVDMILFVNVRNAFQVYRAEIEIALYFIQDVYSFKREYGDDGAVNNLLTVMQKDPTTNHLDLQERFDYAMKLFTAALGRFNKCREKMPSIDEATDGYIAEYADGLIDWVVGNIQWSRMNHRYKVFLNNEDKRNHIIRLDLGSPRILQRFLSIFSILVIVLLVYFLLFL